LAGAVGALVVFGLALLLGWLLVPKQTATAPRNPDHS
jgi:hypothetical protein